MTEYYGKGRIITEEQFNKLDRTAQLELIAFHHMTGEDIWSTLEATDENLAQEYSKESGWEE